MFIGSPQSLLSTVHVYLNLEFLSNIPKYHEATRSLPHRDKNLGLQHKGNSNRQINPRSWIHAATTERGKRKSRVTRTNHMAQSKVRSSSKECTFFNRCQWWIFTAMASNLLELKTSYVDCLPSRRSYMPSSPVLEDVMTFHSKAKHLQETRQIPASPCKYTQHVRRMECIRPMDEQYIKNLTAGSGSMLPHDLFVLLSLI